MDERATTEARVGQLEKRLVRVEAVNRRMRRVGTAAGMMVAGLFLMGVGPTARVPDVLSARSFELVDEGGNVRGLWSSRGDQAIAMVLLDDAGKTNTALQMSKAEPYLALLAGDGKDLVVKKQGQRLFSWGEPSSEPGEHKQWPGWAGDPEEKRGDGPDFDWDLN